MAKAINEREIVAAILMEVTENGRYSHIVLREVLTKYQYLEKRERAFITRVTEGTLEHMTEIDYILDCFSKVKVKKMKPLIRAILRSAVYQIKYMDSIPDHAVCSESVKLAVKKGFSGLRGYVNGVLRSVVKGIDEVEYPSDPIKRLSVRYSCPEWIIRLWKETYDLSLIETMLKDFQTEKPTTIRCCRSRITTEQLKNVLVENHPYLKDALLISKYDYLESLETFREGLFVVQDISSMLVGELAHVQAGAQVIDLCAAPGGKALDVAERILMEGQAGCSGHVEARDLTEYKVSLIEENIERMGLCNVTAVCQDASVYDEKSAGKADIVIADLPCSGLGVLGKKTDLKYKASPEGIVSLVKLQRKILSCAASLRADRVPMFFLISERFSAEESWLSRFSSDSRSNTSILLSSAETAERSTSVSFSMTEMRAASFFRFCVFSAASSSISPIRVLLSAKTSSAAEICER